MKDEQQLEQIRARVEADRGKTFLAVATVEGSTMLSRMDQTRADREALLAEVDRLRGKLVSIARRFEAEDTGEGYPVRGGPLAWAMWADAKQALGESPVPPGEEKAPV